MNVLPISKPQPRPSLPQSVTGTLSTVLTSSVTAPSLFRWQLWCAPDLPIAMDPALTYPSSLPNSHLLLQFPSFLHVPTFSPLFSLGTFNLESRLALPVSKWLHFSSRAPAHSFSRCLDVPVKTKLSSGLKDAAARGRRWAAREQSQSLSELWQADTTSAQEGVVLGGAEE